MSDNAAKNACASATDIRTLIDERVLLLDGSMGVMLQRLGLSEEDFRGDLLRYHPVPLLGNYDILNLTNQDIVARIHRLYLEAGAEIIETNTFNSTVLSQRDYATQNLVRRMNLTGARIARREADIFSRNGCPRFVAGSIGPSGVSASLPSSSGVVFDEMCDAFAEQAGALIDGGVDLLLIETIYDALNAKAATIGAHRAMNERNVEIPLIFSITLSGNSGRLFSGHTLGEFLEIVRPFNPLAVGLNCCSGPESATGHLCDLAAISPFPTIFYPNAGLPDDSGNYAEGPQQFANALMPLITNGVVNIAGGCCGTTPRHIASLRAAIDSCYPSV